MRVLILGASSAVGSALASEFAPGNSLILAGRNRERLAEAEDACRRAGALHATSVAADLVAGVGSLLQAVEGPRIDLIVDAATAASATRDDKIEAGQLQGLLAADLTSKIELLDHLLERQAEAPGVIFVSTVLTLVKSPGRTVYASLKCLNEAYLKTTRERRPDLRLLVVYVGTVIDPRNPSGKASRLARAVGKAFRAGKSRMSFGLSGALLVGLFYVQPVLFLFAISVQRRLRRVRS